MKIKRISIIVAVVLCVAFILPAISTFLPKLESNDPGESVDNVGGVTDDGTTDDENGETPTPAVFGGKTVASYDFSEKLVFNSRYDYEEYPGVFNEGSLKYGSLNTDKGYLEFTSGGDGYSDSPYFGFYLKDTQTSKADGLEFSTCDYITVDYEMWSDGDYLNGMVFRADSRASDLSFARGSSRLITGTGESSYIESSDGGSCYFESSSDRNHYTWVIKIDKEDLSKSYAQVYVNGFYVFKLTSLFTVNAVTLSNFRVDVSSTNASTANDSICFDNFTVNVFGDGTGNYDGILTSLFDDTSIHLYDCVDSILYKGK